MSPTDAIRDLLSRYGRALNEGDAVQAVECYTPDAVVAGAGFPTLHGSDLAGAYAQMLGAEQMAVTFEVEEIVVTGEDTAWARTTSHGTQTSRGSGEQRPESNRELFILQRSSGNWRIARYLFNETP